MTPSRRPGRSSAAGIAIAATFLFGAWAVAAAAVGKPFLPSPAKAAAAFARLAADGALGVHAGASLSRVAWALVASFVPAAALGLAAGRSARVDAVVSPLVYILHPLPKAAFLPIILLAFGLGEASKIFLVGVIIFSQVLVSARDSARRIPRQLIDSVRSLGASRLSLAVLVVVPASLPDLLTSLRVSLGTAVAVLFLAETFATETGLGYLIVDSWARVAYPEMYAAIIAMSLLGLGLFAAVDAAERLLCPWRSYRT
ncbi:MAG: ABC transporter permease [Spirochaetes bacterium]|nr:ABC transporter permease [Spirochaetota bacterium]MBU1079241.1 ABC transporter permease [Spirochaetota bacterium]